MRSYSLIAPGKINLYLEIIGDRPDGYHELAMVLQSISLADKIHIRSIGIETIVVRCDHPLVPQDVDNIAYRAASLMSKEFPEVFARYGGVEITINKYIPMAAGLAGGSTNAAAVLVGLDLMWELGLTHRELQELGARLGSDVPFCIGGGTALGTRRGEILSPLPNLDHIYVVLAKYKNLSISTPWAYKTYRQKFGHTYISDTESQKSSRQRVHSGPMVSAIVEHNHKEVGELLHNDLEKVALSEYPQLLKLREAFASENVLGTMMSGSGPTMFALTESQSQAEEVRAAVKEKMADPDLEFWIAQLNSNGISIAH
ncbi:MAG: 4-(cytidine 5'-diphospho)-2-C-methyl-D-erythritol kinase [Trichodesmium sp. St16_bin4-tuft]|nr:4-(cytidine 5'-diphospho)-2-C-methyl-D-erythritol kinase [Trichodesmium sp. MAG_R01]MDE5069087.1 4-(cytidine 5'-diphospho)-2-C-methyl-D-erythritol kinase [Trichodesmium sp. St4_bin8_1]MDE5071775.1 4-(cytidine 5'-diphospho)-2-C-methyl-D-erythritol kinase [Trichodesmium sp. St5_bin8]MDE5077470.1 4-(cytidine 5'-diphospho)-2-C-methyl-D-erythritol kinase [Trichodesmium sp. St2_bin6]MDE5091848.1 4-(cytidine 5'-diphospho)-2-C-methyl-D-erythritol kinase [Trichodesmium sp. St18_bin3_1_1]MDE5098998.1